MFSSFHIFHYQTIKKSMIQNEFYNERWKHFMCGQKLNIKCFTIFNLWEFTQKSLITIQFNQWLFNRSLKFLKQKFLTTNFFLRSLYFFTCFSWDFVRCFYTSTTFLTPSYNFWASHFCVWGQSSQTLCFHVSINLLLNKKFCECISFFFSSKLGLNFSFINFLIVV